MNLNYHLFRLNRLSHLHLKFPKNLKSLQFLMNLQNPKLLKNLMFLMTP
jgi:hypothetical protein